jgi:hypothetical protein
MSCPHHFTCIQLRTNFFSDALIKRNKTIFHRKSEKAAFYAKKIESALKIINSETRAGNLIFFAAAEKVQGN